MTPGRKLENIEREQVLSQFLRAFNHLRGTPVVLYGVGANTPYLLNRLTDFDIVGLMDQENTGRELFGLPVLSPEQVARRAKTIIIVARPAVVLIIYARIAALAADHGLKVYDLAGNDLTAERSPATNPAPADFGRGEADLRSAIDQAQVVSFDIFDTLLMRKVLRPENVFDIVEGSLPGELHLQRAFKPNRILAEEIANERHGAPSIEQIYQELSRLLSLTDVQRDAVQGHEIAVQASLLVPRAKMLALMRQAVAQGKRVFLVSDMYLGKKLLSPILAGYGVTGYEELLVSCDLGSTKRSGGLFDILAERTRDAAVLHVGDDRVADLEAPSRLGISTFQVLSGYELLVRSPFAHLLSRVASSSDAHALGLLVARAFNDPFSLESTGGILKIGSDFELGYLAFGAVVSGFIRWLADEVRGQAGAAVLFGARDGYLLKLLYDRFVKRRGLKDLPRSIYFLTSRRAASVPCIRDADDIDTLLGRVPGNPRLGDLLERTFGLTVEPTEPEASIPYNRESYEAAAGFIRKHEPRILQNARCEMQAYRRYIASLGIGAGDRLFFVDLITAGSIPYFLDIVLGAHPTYLCFAVTLPLRHPVWSPLRAYLGEVSSYHRGGGVVGAQYVIESILTAPSPELRCFDESGEPVYSSDVDDSHALFDKVRLAQQGISAFFDEFCQLAGVADSPPISVALADEIAGLLCSGYCVVDEAVQQSYRVSQRYTFGAVINPWTTTGRAT